MKNINNTAVFAVADADKNMIFDLFFGDEDMVKEILDRFSIPKIPGCLELTRVFSPNPAVRLSVKNTEIKINKLFRIGDDMEKFKAELGSDKKLAKTTGDDDDEVGRESGCDACSTA